MKLLLPRLLSIIFASLLFVTLAPSVKAAGNLYFSPASGTKYNGQNFTIAVRASGMDGIDAVNATFTYPADKLTFVSISSGSSAWDVKAEEGGGSGTVTLQRGSTNSLTGDKLVANVTFKPKTNTGTAALSFAGDAALTRAGSNVISGKSGATFTLAQPAAAPPPPAADTTAPVISDIKVINPTLDSATITWKTNEAADSNVDYGTELGYFITASNSALATEHSITLNSKFIESGSTYHFIVRSKDAAGNEVKSADQKFSTLGYDLLVTLKDESGKVLTNAKASLYSKPQIAFSDKNGVVTFKNVPSGEHLLVVETKDQKVTQTIEVKNTGVKEIKVKDNAVLKTDPQKFDVKIAAASILTKPMQTLGYVLIISGVALIIIILAAYFVLRRKKQNKAFPKNSTN
jgi:hypothetical protein